MVSIRMPALTPSLSRCLSLWSVIASIVAAVAAAVALFLPCVLLCLFVALGLYTFLFTHHRASALCVEISPEWFLYIHSAVKLQIRTEDRRKTTYIFVLACARVDQSQMWLMIAIQANAAPIAPFYNNSGHMYTYILYICIQISNALLSSSFSLHDCTIIITALFHLLVFSIIFSGWFCIALLTLKTKWQICKNADAYADSAANAAACRYLLGQLPQSVGNHNKKLILINRFSCNCCQLRYAPRRIRERDDFATALALTLASLLVFSERGREQRTLECSSSAV